ncbi:MAG: hypothetical protein Q7R92_00205 [bacterium]|nr:hypothetical protein [bacterium]
MPLTPEEFNKLVTKEEFNELRKDVRKIDGKMDKLLGAVEGIATQHKNFKLEMTANQGAHDRFEERITGLEKKQGITQFA